MSAGAALMSIGTMAPSLPGLAGMVPGGMENRYRRMIKSDIERLSQGRGGMAEGQRQSLQAQAMGNIAAQQRQAMAQLARGQGQQGASGLQAQQVNEVMRAGQQAALQAQGSIRQQDLALAEHQRQGLDQRMQNAIQVRMQRMGLGHAGAQAQGPDTYQSGQGQRMGIGQALYDAGNQFRVTARQ